MSDTEAAVEPPAWFPQSQAWFESWTDQTKTLTVRSNGNSVMTFGPDVPDGATLVIVDAGHLRTVQVASEGRVDLVLRGGWQGVRLEGPVKTVTVESPGLDTTIYLTSDGVTVAGAGGQNVYVNGEHVEQSGEETTKRPYTYTFKRLPDAHSGNRPVLAGHAALKRIEGVGDLRVRCSLVPGDDKKRPKLVTKYDGELDFEGMDLRGFTLASPALTLSTESIRHCTISAVRVNAVGAVAASTITAESIFANEVADSTVNIASTQVGPGIAVGRLRSPDTSEAINIAFGEDGSVATSELLGSHGPVRRSSLTCTGPGDIHVGSAELSSLESDAGIAIYNGYSGVPDRGVAVRAGGDVQVRGDLLLERGRVEAGRNLYVQGNVADGALDATNVVLVTGRVAGCQVTSDDIRIVSGIEHSNLRARVATLAGGVDASTRLTVGGTGTVLPEGFAGELEWTGSGELTLRSQPGPVIISGGTRESPATLTVEAAEVELATLVCAGFARVVWAPNDRQTHGFQINLLDLAGRNGTDVTFHCAANANVVKIIEGIGSAVGSAGAGRLALTVDGCRRLHVRPDAGASIRVQMTDADVTLAVSGGGKFIVAGQLAELAGPLFEPDLVPVQVPQLEVPAEGSVEKLTGCVRLGRVDGRVIGRAAAKSGRRRFNWRAVADITAPRILDIEKQAEIDEQGGHVVDVDPTLVSFHKLLHVDGFHVFEPSPQALIDWARNAGGGDAHRQREAAYKAQRIAEQVAKTASAGSARAAAQWAAAHTHHRAMRNAPVEKGLRWIHRAFGYSHRPGPPLTAYLTITTVIAVVTWTQQLANGFFSGVGGAGAVFLHTALLPASWILRLPTNDDAQFFTVEWLNPVVFVAAGLPLVFFVIALRHFLAPPGD